MLVFREIYTGPWTLNNFFKEHFLIGFLLFWLKHVNHIPSNSSYIIEDFVASKMPIIYTCSSLNLASYAFNVFIAIDEFTNRECMDEQFMQKIKNVGCWTSILLWLSPCQNGLTYVLILFIMKRKLYRPKQNHDP